MFVLITWNNVGDGQNKTQVCKNVKKTRLFQYN